MAVSACPDPPLPSGLVATPTHTRWVTISTVPGGTLTGGAHHTKKADSGCPHRGSWASRAGGVFWAGLGPTMSPFAEPAQGTFRSNRATEFLPCSRAGASRGGSGHNATHCQHPLQCARPAPHTRSGPACTEGRVPPAPGPAVTKAPRHIRTSTCSSRRVPRSSDRSPGVCGPDCPLQGLQAGAGPAPGFIPDVRAAAAREAKGPSRP